MERNDLIKKSINQLHDGLNDHGKLFRHVPSVGDNFRGHCRELGGSRGALTTERNHISKRKVPPNFIRASEEVTICETCFIVAFIEWHVIDPFYLKKDGERLCNVSPLETSTRK
jgi:hypothetical protein